MLDDSVSVSVINLVIQNIRKYLGNKSLHNFDENVIYDMVSAAYKITDELYNEGAAQKWAGGFNFPPNVRSHHALLVKEKGGIKQTVRFIHATKSANRITPHRVHQYVHHLDPDFQRILEIAGGIKITTVDGFSPNRTPGRLRQKYIRLKGAINKLIYKNFEKELVLILPLPLVLAEFPDAHF